jgi:hypothetical protein
LDYSLNIRALVKVLSSRRVLKIVQRRWGDRREFTYPSSSIYKIAPVPIFRPARVGANKR